MQISILILANKDPESLTRTIPALMEQEWSGVHEIVVVRESKNGETLDTLKPFMQKWSEVISTYVPDKPQYISALDVAVTLGVKAAHYPNIVVVGSDFEPESKSWLADVAEHLQLNENDMVMQPPLRVGMQPFANTSFIHKCKSRRQVSKLLSRWAKYAKAKRSTLCLGRKEKRLFSVAFSKSVFLDDIMLRNLIFKHQSA